MYSCIFSVKRSYLGRQVAVVAGGGQRREAEARLAAGKGGRRLHERRGVAEGAETPLLGEQLLVGQGVDGVREGEGRAAGSRGGSQRHHRIGIKPGRD